jgi:hypothetical protein
MSEDFNIKQIRAVYSEIRNALGSEYSASDILRATLFFLETVKLIDAESEALDEARSAIPHHALDTFTSISRADGFWVLENEWSYLSGGIDVERPVSIGFELKLRNKYSHCIEAQESNRLKNKLENSDPDIDESVQNSSRPNSEQKIVSPIGVGIHGAVKLEIARIKNIITDLEAIQLRPLFSFFEKNNIFPSAASGDDLQKFLADWKFDEDKKPEMKRMVIRHWINVRDRIE